jgi:hypothetical protein
MLLSILLAAAVATTEGELSSLSADALMACTQSADHCQALDWDLARELAKRESSAALLARLRHAKGQRVVVFALYLQKPDEQVKKAMRQLWESKDEEIAYYSLNYLARLCDPQALRKLSAPPYEPRAACQQWATTVGLFGQCKYRPAKRLLLASLDNACGNVIDAAGESLRAIFPGAPKFESLSEEKAWFSVR